MFKNNPFFIISEVVKFPVAKIIALDGAAT